MDREIIDRLPQVEDDRVARLALAVCAVWHPWNRLPVNPADTLAYQGHAWALIEETLGHARRLAPPILSRSDLGGGPSVFHHLEGADLLGLDGDEDLLHEELRKLMRLDVRGITPIFSHGNHFGGGSNEVGAESEGLTPFGEELLMQMAELGMLIDTAHMNVRTRGDVLRLLGGRVRLAYTHGGLEGMVRFESGQAQERGIPVEHAEEIRRNGGIVGLSVSKPFVHSRSEFDVSLDVLLASRYGSRGIGIGTDFGGVSQQEILPGLAHHDDIIDYLLVRQSRGEISSDAVNAIAYENALDVLHDVLKRRREICALGL